MQVLHRPSEPAALTGELKGWTGPSVVDGKPVENTWRSHQVPLSSHAEFSRLRDGSEQAGFC